MPHDQNTTNTQVDPRDWTAQAVRFQYEKDNVPEPWSGPLSVLIGTTHAFRSSKKGFACFSLATYREGSKRGNENVVLLNGLVFDYDHIPSSDLEVLQSELSSYAHVIYTSFSHHAKGPDDNCVRVVLPISRPVTPDEYKGILRNVETLLKVKADKSAKDPSRVWYLPCCPEERKAEAFVRYCNGRVLDVETILTASAQEDFAQEHAQPGINEEETISEGQRHAYLVSLGGTLRRKGLSPAAIAACLHEANRDKLRPPLPEEEVNEIANSMGKYAPGDTSSGDNHTKDGEEKGASVAVILSGVGSRYALFHDEKKDPYAVVRLQNRQQILHIESQLFSDLLTKIYFEETGKAPTTNGLDMAIKLLRAKALFDGERLALENRFAYRDDIIWIDMADEDGQAIKITDKGWEVVKLPPPLFRRYSHQSALPVPASSGGDLKALLSFLHLKEPDTEGMLLLSWLVTAIISNIPRHILCFNGPQGSAKTTAATFLRQLIDPSETPNLDLDGTPHELALIMEHHAVPMFDNLSTISLRQGNFLCKTTTGGGLHKRKLYTDVDDVILKFKRPVIITGINVPTEQPDLLDRFLLVTLERLTKEQRQEEGQLLRAFETARPKILAGLLDTLSKAMAVYPTIQLKEQPRMVDAARWGAAVAEVLGYGASAYEAAINANTNRQQQEVHEDIVFQAVIGLLQRYPHTFTGTMTELLKALVERDKGLEKQKGWPRGAAALAQRVNTLESSFAEVGIKMERHPGHRCGRRITIRDEKAIEDTAKTEAGRKAEGNQTSTSNETNMDALKTGPTPDEDEDFELLREVLGKKAEAES